MGQEETAGRGRGQIMMGGQEPLSPCQVFGTLSYKELDNSDNSVLSIDRRWSNLSPKQ